MKTRYVLIDYENVQPRDLALLNGQPAKVIVFVGANQSRLPTDLVLAMQPRGSDGDFVRISGNGRNALDFHIAFYLGKLATEYPEASFHVISKDDGYDPLLKHLKQKGIDARRSTTVASLAPDADDKVGKVIAQLRKLGPARPRRTKTLANTINALLGKSLGEEEIHEIIEVLERRGVITQKEGKVAYGALT
jgi:hypothetical protein